MARIYVDSSDNDFPDARFQNRVGTGRRTPDCGTGLKRNVERRASRDIRTEAAQALNLRMLTACSSVASSCHYPVVNDQNRADRRIGASLTMRFSGFSKRFAHESFVALSIRRHGARCIILAGPWGNSFPASVLCKAVTSPGVRN